MMDPEGRLFAGVELGGTNVVCGVSGPDGIGLRRAQARTGDPETTLSRIEALLAGLVPEGGEIRGMGVVTFGPVHLDPDAPDYGTLGETPKPGWRGFDVAGAFESRFGLPVRLETDVIGAAIGEATRGAGRGFDPLVYITVGTGIGGGVLVRGRPVHGLLHPELGHMRAPRASGDGYAGGCPVHGDCIEGMAAGPHIVARWGEPLEALGETHRAYRVVAHYLSHLVVNTILCIAPRRIILGGGVMSNPALFPAIRRGVRELLGGYWTSTSLGGRSSDTSCLPVSAPTPPCWGRSPWPSRTVDAPESAPTPDPRAIGSRGPCGGSRTTPNVTSNDLSCRPPRGETAGRKGSTPAVVAWASGGDDRREPGKAAEVRRLTSSRRRVYVADS